MATHCDCGDDERDVVRTVPWQRDFCNACGQPLPPEPAVDR